MRWPASGLTRDDSHASLVVQISAMARYARDWASWPYYDPYWGPRWGWGMSYGRGWGRDLAAADVQRAAAGYTAP
jgi:hypothetical protein